MLATLGICTVTVWIHCNIVNILIFITLYRENKKNDSDSVFPWVLSNSHTKPRQVDRPKAWRDNQTNKQTHTHSHTDTCSVIV